jgi:hypothetical protein
MKPNILELVDVVFHSSTQPTHFLILDFIKSSILIVLYQRWTIFCSNVNADLSLD